ncbi:vesicular glutamate transporter 2-like [Planococcus citri]|uniref:vesicular glutamate transporter 2-like n=1 Tax=Planococcus citri TaxID=170843 RepID=UPI0031F7AC96
MEKYKFWFSKRFAVGILAFFGEMNMFALKANLNIAILDMTSKTEIVIGNTTVTRNPEFNWDSKTKGFILSAHEYGLLSAPLGGYLATRFGGSTVITISNLIISILTILTPLIIRCSFQLFIVDRIIEGVTYAFRFVSLADLWSKWSPNRDRSKLMAITLTGMGAAPAITYPIFGVITRKYGWPATFYFSGAISLLWSAIWIPLVPNSPASDKWISKEELSYIQQDPKQSRPKNIKAIWKNMIFSKHVYAAGLAKAVYTHGLTITVVCLPMYIQDLTGSKIDKIGMYAAIPTFVGMFTLPLTGFMMDYLNNTSSLNLTQIHKSFMCAAFGVGGVLLLAMAYLPHNFIFSMICLSLLKSTVSVNEVVCNLNAIALAPKCPSVLISFTVLFYMLGASTGTLIVAFIVTGHSLSQWSTAFTTFAMILFLGAIMFLVMGSAEPQPWSFSVDEQKKKSELQEDQSSPPKVISK